MEKLRNFVKTSVLGGLIVTLPVAIIVIVFNWIFKFVTGLLRPMTNLVVARSNIREIIADVIVLVTIVLFCFLVGVFVKTGIGRFLHSFVENNLLRIAPGYTFVKEAILQLFGNKKASFSKVALVNVFGNDILTTGFVTDEHEDGSYTVFVPTAPNPTTGFIYHMAAKYVHFVNVSVDEAMRTIIGAGSGSNLLVDKYLQNNKKT